MIDVLEIVKTLTSIKASYKSEILYLADAVRT